MLNSLVLAAGLMNGKPAISDREGRSIHFSFYQRQVGIRLDRLKRPKRRGYVANSPDADDAKLSLSISPEPRFGKRAHRMAGRCMPEQSGSTLKRFA